MAGLLDGDTDAQELLEWRDLQATQATSMQHVWDNPEDEHWNKLPMDTPTPNPTHFDTYPHLTDAQYDLFDRMSEISEDCLCAGWVTGNEYSIWNTITLGDPGSAYPRMNPRLVRRCKQLANEISGWIHWTADGPQSVPMAQWLAMVAQRKHADNACPTEPSTPP